MEHVCLDGRCRVSMRQKNYSVRRKIELLPLRTLRFCLSFLFAMSVLTGWAFAQSPSATLRGIVTDPSGAVIPGATITVKAPGIQPVSTKTDGAGAYEIKGLQPGKYIASIAAKGFSVVA